jgi:hypothetical protein
VALIGTLEQDSTTNERGGHVQNDVVRAPGAATRCTASVEGGAKSLFCHRSPEGRYQVVFYTDSIVVWKNGNPDKPVFSARWQR